jgi:hypothetical protein
MREPNESESAYMKRCFKEVLDEEGLDSVEDQLKEEGYKIENIRPRKSERRQEIRKQQKAVVKTGVPLSPEAIVELLPAPTDVDGRVDGAFVAGMRYEAMNVIRGIRLAQELSKMAIDQASPVIRMAQEMRAAEGKAADEAAMKAAAGVGAQIMPRIDQLAAQVAGGGENPMMSLMMTLMQPAFQQAAQHLAKFFGATQMPGHGQQSQEQQAEQPPVEQQTQVERPQAQPAGSSPNIKQRSIKEWEDS